MINLSIKYAIHVILFIIVYLIAISCSDRGRYAKFRIVNDLPYRIDSLVILPNKDLNKYISINPGEVKEYSCNMTGGAKVDGSYQLTFRANLKTRTEVFGYFTNGYPLEEMTTINIKPDTILFKFNVK